MGNPMLVMAQQRATVIDQQAYDAACKARVNLIEILKRQGVTDNITPQVKVDDNGSIGPALCELFQGYAFAMRLWAGPCEQCGSTGEPLDTSPEAQHRAAAAAEEASWRRRTGPEVWFDRQTIRERRAQRMQERVSWFIGGAGVLAVLEVLAWAVTR